MKKDESSWMPWILLGTACLVLGATIVFLESTEEARQQRQAVLHVSVGDGSDPGTESPDGFPTGLVLGVEVGGEMRSRQWYLDNRERLQIVYTLFLDPEEVPYDLYSSRFADVE